MCPPSLLAARVVRSEPSTRVAGKHYQVRAGVLDRRKFPKKKAHMLWLAARKVVPDVRPNAAIPTRIHQATTGSAHAAIATKDLEKPADLKDV